MKSVTTSAPGKLMLFGEHAVLYGHPCIVTAVGQRLYLSIEQRAKGRGESASISIEAPDVNVSHYEKSLSALGQGDIPKGARFIEIAVKNFLEYCHAEASAEASNKKRSFAFAQDDSLGLYITTKSEFSSEFGFGSSSASTVCVLKALSEIFNLELSNKELFDLAYKTVLDIQKKGSGFDIAAAIYGGTLSFVSSGEVIESLAVDELPLVVGYSGVKADTVQYIEKVAEKVTRFPDLLNKLFLQVAAVSSFAKFALIEKDWKTVGELMDVNQGYLEALGVSTAKLSSMIYAARDAGALGAKLSGAGGGDCMIALVETRNKLHVTRAIEKADGKIIDVETNVEGVRVEIGK